MELQNYDTYNYNPLANNKEKLVEIYNVHMSSQDFKVTRVYRWSIKTYKNAFRKKNSWLKRYESHSYEIQSFSIKLSLAPFLLMPKKHIPASLENSVLKSILEYALRNINNVNRPGTKRVQCALSLENAKQG